MRISEQLAHMESAVAELSAQLAELRLEAEKLEEENEWLRAQITPVIDKNRETTSGKQALQQLYDEGYHVCPTYFGKAHDGGCLFCMEVLNNVAT